MGWKDFLYFQRGSKVAVILLLILIVLTLILNAVISRRSSSEIVLEQNDSIIREFEAFRQTLKEKEPASSEEQEERTTSRNYPGRNYLEGEFPPREMESARSDRQESHFAPHPGGGKLSRGETISLNETDTAQWKMIPGIGRVYSSRIIKYRDLLGGFVRKEQLLEVYGIDNELFSRIVPYIEEDTNFTKLKINELEFSELLRHPYLNYKQVRVIVNLRQRKGNIVSINELAMFDEFTSDDIFRLEPYLEF